MAALSAFMPAILIEADGVPEMVAEVFILRAASEFCERGLVWWEWSDPELFVNGQADYDLSLPSGARLAQVRELWSGATPLKGTDQTTVAREVYGWQTAEGDPSHFVMASMSPPSVRFYPKPKNPAAGSSFTAMQIYAPAPGATKLPDLLATHYLFEIADGAKAYLLDIPNKSWSNPGRAKQLRDEFEAHIGRARIAFEHGFVGGNTTVTPREFG